MIDRSGGHFHLAPRQENLWFTRTMGECTEGHEADLARREAEVRVRELALAERTSTAQAILAAADARDARADLRDAAAEERENDLDRAKLLVAPNTYGDDWPERRNAGLDRKHSRDDRTASHDDRVHLAERDAAKTSRTRLEPPHALGQRTAVYKPDWSHTTALEAAPTSASGARAFVTHHLVDHGLLHLVDPVRLVASELATNALVHAQTAFSVTLSASDTRVLLTVRDHSQALPERCAPHASDEAGRGLEVVDIVSLDWGINEDGVGSKAVWASFAIRGRRES